MWLKHVEVKYEGLYPMTEHLEVKYKGLYPMTEHLEVNIKKILSNRLNCL